MHENDVERVSNRNCLIRSLLIVVIVWSFSNQCGARSRHDTDDMIYFDREYVVSEV